jgi:hypothetical protein
VREKRERQAASVATWHDTTAPVPGWKSFSQSGQVNFSRTICTTFHCRGATVEMKS